MGNDNFYKYYGKLLILGFPIRPPDGLHEFRVTSHYARPWLTVYGKWMQLATGEENLFPKKKNGWKQYIDLVSRFYRQNKETIRGHSINPETI